MLTIDSKLKRPYLGNQSIFAIELIRSN